MYNTLAVVLFACVAAVTCNDIQVGSNHGRKIFDEEIQASPAIWKQVQNITINTTLFEEINAVVVTDQRPEKDGFAKIIEGGKGHKNVTILLQSPTVFRGFDFHVVVYAIQDDDAQADAQHPAVLANDTQIILSAKSEDEDIFDSVTSIDIKHTVPANVDEKPVEKDVDEKPVVKQDVDEKPVEKEGKPSAPVTTGDQTRPSRNTQSQQDIDPIVQYVNQEQAEFPANAGQEKTTLSSHKVNGQELTTDNAHKVNVNVTSTTAKPDANNEKKTQTFDHDIILPRELSKEDPRGKAFDVKVREDQSSTTARVSTGAADVTTPTSSVQTNQQNFDSISQELGQKVLYGIKKH